MAMATAEPDATPDDRGLRPAAGADRTAVTVTALLVVQDPDNPYLEHTLAALAELQQRPQRLVVVDATADRAVRDLVDDQAHAPWREQYPEVSVVAVPPGAPFAEIVDTAVEALPGPGEDLVVARRPRQRARARETRVRDRDEWFWLLHEDSQPAPGSLRALLQVAGRSQRVGVAGCKVVQAQQPDLLVNVGLDLTRTGRHVGTHMQGEPDQGQHDTRSDVLAVSSAGMLIRRDVYLGLGGFDPAFDGEGDGLDLCWRTHLLGHQVVVVPQAVVRQEIHDPEAGRTLRRAGRTDADQPAPRSARTLRRHRQVALARCSPLALPFMALWVGLSGLLLALLMLVLKRPRRSLTELAQATAPLGVGRILGARSRFGGRGRTRRRHLGALFVPAGAAARDALDQTRAALTPAPDDPDAAHESVVSQRRSLAARIVLNPGLWLFVTLLAATLVRWRDHVGSGALRGTAQGFAGGQLLPFSTDAEGIWRLWRDRWSGPGLGELGTEHPYLPVLAGLARGAELLPWVDDATSGATVVGWLLLLGVPLSGLSAYLAGRAATRAAWPRAAAGLAWAGLATVSVATAEGRLGPVVGHVLLPVVLAGTLSVARRRAGVPSTFGTVLAAAVMGAFAPVLLALTTVVALGVVLVGSGWARLRGLVVAVGPWGLLGPWTGVRLLDDPRALLAGPGGLTSAAAPEPWQLALLHPGGAGSYPAWWTAPVLAVGLLALGARARGRVRLVVGLALTALLGLAAGLAAQQVTVTDLAGQARVPWPGLPLDLAGAALLGLALVAFGDTFRAGRRPRGAGVRAASVALLVTGIVAAVVVVGAVAWDRPIRTLQTAPEPVPAVAANQAQGQRATRMLTLTVERDGDVTYRLDGRETGRPVRDLDVPASSDPLVARTVRALLTDSGRDSGVQDQLSRLAVGFVGLTGPGDSSTVARQLAVVEGLSPMAAGSDLTLFRVLPRPETVPMSRLRIERDGQVLSAVGTDDPNARTTARIPAGPQGRVLAVSEAPDWARLAEVTLDGEPLRRVAGEVPTYALPTTGGELQVGPAVAYPRWRWAQGAALAVVAFLAVPFGNARSRRRG